MEMKLNLKGDDGVCSKGKSNSDSNELHHGGGKKSFFFFGY